MQPGSSEARLVCCNPIGSKCCMVCQPERASIAAGQFQFGGNARPGDSDQGTSIRDGAHAISDGSNAGRDGEAAIGTPGYTGTISCFAVQSSVSRHPCLQHAWQLPCRAATGRCRGKTFWKQCPGSAV